MENFKSLGLTHGNGSALDFGCGAGRLSQALACHFEDIVGVDISPSMLEVARSLNRYTGRCTYVHNEVESLEHFPDNSFDLVYSNIVLQHIEPKFSKNYIAEFIRVVKKGGLIAFQLPSHRKQRGGIVSRIGRLFIPSNVLDKIFYLRSHRLPKDGSPIMEMYGIRRAEVEKFVDVYKGKLIDVVEVDGGPTWTSYRYCISK
jgi:ubiquinone/menaquinone biosynthesis C-methylase UbiE